MEIQLVRSFLAVVRTGSVTAAARELGYSQPAITAHLNAFDRQVGGSVLERGRGGAILTPLGERMLPRAARVVAEHDALLAEASDAGGTGTHLVVGYATSTILPYVERLAQIAARVLPRVRLSVVALERPSQIGNDLLAHLVDLQVVPGPLDDPRLVSRLLHPLRVGVRVTAASPLAPMASVPLEVILGRPLHRLEGVPLAWDRYWCAWTGHGGPPEPGRDAATSRRRDVRRVPVDDAGSAARDDLPVSAVRGAADRRRVAPPHRRRRGLARDRPPRQRPPPGGPGGGLVGSGDGPVGPLGDRSHR